MPRYDLNGDPLPDDTPAAPPQPAQQYDLTGNPLPPSIGTNPGSYIPTHSEAGMGGVRAPSGYPPPSAPPYPSQPQRPGSYLPPGAPGPAPTSFPPVSGNPLPPVSPYQAAKASTPVKRRRTTAYVNGRFVFVGEKNTSTPRQKLIRALLGIGIALLICIPGYIGMMKLIFVLPSAPAIIYIFPYAILGGVIGFGARFATGKAGIASIGIAIGIAALCEFIGYITFSADLLREIGSPDGVTALSYLPTAVSHLVGIHWLNVSVGLLTAVRIAAIQGEDHGT